MSPFFILHNNSGIESCIYVFWCARLPGLIFLFRVTPSQPNGVSGAFHHAAHRHTPARMRMPNFYVFFPILPFFRLHQQFLCFANKTTKNVCITCRSCSLSSVTPEQLGIGLCELVWAARRGFKLVCVNTQSQIKSVYPCDGIRGYKAGVGGTSALS